MVIDVELVLEKVRDDKKSISFYLYEEFTKNRNNNRNTFILLIFLVKERFICNHPGLNGKHKCSNTILHKPELKLF